MNPTTAEECELLADSKYRAYISQVEKALRAFENTSEWADLISALGKLNKVLTIHVKYPVIPKRVTIGKRLAQCLHPALPSGVHLKALETYDIIFKCIGTHRLSADLFTYCAGLFPVLGYAAMSVRPQLLAIYETHFVPLGRHVRPALGGMLLGLLPGLEEGSEYYDRTNQLLEEFCMTTQPAFFYGCLWECVLASSVARLPAFTFVCTHYNKKQTMDDQIHFMGNNIDVLLCALCTSLGDTSVLVQRSALDFILAGFLLHTHTLTSTDMTSLMTAAIKVLLRRDMSLNRRLYSWLTGVDSVGAPLLPRQASQTDKPRADSEPDDDTALSASYFEQHGRALLTTAIQRMIIDTADGPSTVDGKPANMRPFRILISLLDKLEVGGVILEDVLIPILRFTYMQHEALCGAGDDTDPVKPTNGRKGPSRSADKQMAGEVIKTLNLLFSSFEAYFIWDFLGRQFGSVCASLPPDGSQGGAFVLLDGALTVGELCLITEFLLDKVALDTYAETQTEYLPEMLHQLTLTLAAHCALLTDAELTQALRLCSKLLSNVLPSMTPVQPTAATASSNQQSPIKHVPRQEVQLTDADNPNPQDTGTDVATEPWEVIEEAKEAIDLDPGERKPRFRDGLGDKHEGQATPLLLRRAVGANMVDTVTEFVRHGSPGGVAKSGVEYTHDPSQQTLIQACVESFQDLFCVVVTSRILTSPEVTSTLLTQLLKPTSPLRQFLKRLQTLLPSPDDENTHLLTTLDGEALCGAAGRAEMKALPLPAISSNVCEAFACACHLLVELSCFPMYCVDHQQAQNTFIKSKTHNFPEWLQLLLTTACFVVNFELQMSAISTMLDLISLTKSVVGDKIKCDIGDDDEEEEVESKANIVSVVIVPSLSPQCLYYLNNQTSFYKVVAVHLWTYLGENTPAWHHRSMELLSALHQLAPSAWVCEDVIGDALLADDKRVRLDAHRKFAVLWHLLRSQAMRAQPGLPIRTFDRSMFLMLDSLQSDTNPCRALTQTWLTHAIQRGDVARLLQPLLLVLLHPDTARISIQHVSITAPRRMSGAEQGVKDSGHDDSEARIYAISSEGGNVIYHVSNNTQSPVPTARRPKSEDLRTFALTTITEQGANTQSAPDKKAEDDMPFERVNPHHLNLRVNPFGSESSLDRLVIDGYKMPTSKSMPNIENAKRLSSATCRQEGIFFDDFDAGESNTDGVESSPIRELTPTEIVESILDDILEKVFAKDPPPIVLQMLNKSDSSENLSGLKKLKKAVLSPFKQNSTDDLLNALDAEAEEEIDFRAGGAGVHPLHTHLLIYIQKYDAQRTLYALTCLNAMLSSTPRLVTCAMATTSISASDTPHVGKLQALLLRHRRSVFGKNFFSELPGDAASNFKSSMYVEVVVSVCLYMVRSYYPNLMMSKLTEAELNGNKEVQILACEILTLLLSELVTLVKDSGRAFASYIRDLLQRCKVQKALLHCLLASVHNSRRKPPGGRPGDQAFTEVIVTFNEDNMDANTNQTFQTKLLRLMLVVILLEDQLRVTGGESEFTVPPEWEKSRPTFTPTLANLKYVTGRPVVGQTMLLWAILAALKQQHHTHMHRHWLSTVTSALPYMGRALGVTVVAVVSQICRNLEMLAGLYRDVQGENTSGGDVAKVPPDHVLFLLEGLLTITHYCLLDNAPLEVSMATVLPHHHNNIVNDTATAMHIFSNLINVFSPSQNKDAGGVTESSSSGGSCVLEARRALLSILPQILASLTILWKACNISEAQKETTGRDEPWWTLGPPKTIRQQILEFASPVSRLHSVNMLGAVAVVWTDRRQYTPLTRRVVAAACDDQLLLVEVVSHIRVLPLGTLIQTVRTVMRQPPPTNLDKTKKRLPLEVSILQFFYAYVQRVSAASLALGWPQLLQLFKDGLTLNLTPPGVFLLLAILDEFVQKVPVLEEKKDQKDLQDMAQRLLLGVAEIAGTSLEQATWMRRQLTVRLGRQVDVTDDPESEDDDEGEADDEGARPYSVCALTLLGELIAPLCDVIYTSEEKEHIVPFLTNVVYNVFPYLRNHSPHNLPSFRAASQILASLSSYPYTRKAWRRETIEMLFEVPFFSMHESCIGYWKVVVDNLMTHDKITFKDLLSRVLVAASSSMSIFSSREAEFEQRAQLLKRLSFTIFCSEEDQYQRHMPDIQGRLSDSIRLTSAPVIQAQVFYCFRVLVLRMTPHHLTSLWPPVITELVHVLFQLEQDLTPEIEDTKMQLARMSNLDSSWSLGNGLTTHNNPAWLQLYLAACKLLDLTACLPTDRLPQFQLYRWAFTGNPGSEEELQEKEGPVTKRRFKEHKPGFVPHVLRIARLMRQKYGVCEVVKTSRDYPLLLVPAIRSIQDLHLFFSTLAERAEAGQAFNADNDQGWDEPPWMAGAVPGPRPPGLALPPRQYIEKMVEADFLDKPAKTP